MSEDLPILNPTEARVLGCLIEKKELTPDVYPLTLNAALAAANQKTAREPVMALEQTEVHRALKLLEQKGLVRQMFGSRVERYEHQMAQRFSLTTPQAANGVASAAIRVTPATHRSMTCPGAIPPSTSFDASSPGMRPPSPGNWRGT